MVSCVWWCTKVTPLAPAGSVLVCTAAASSPTVISWWDVCFCALAAHRDLGPKCYSWFVLGQGASGAASGCWQLFQLGERRTAHVSNLYFEDRGTVSYPVWKVHPRSPQARGKNQKHLCEISHLPLAINQKDSKGAFCLSVAWISVPGDASSRPSLMVCSHSTNSITQILLVLLQGGCELLSPQPHPPV